MRAIICYVLLMFSLLCMLRCVCVCVSVCDDDDCTGVGALLRIVCACLRTVIFSHALTRSKFNCHNKWALRCYTRARRNFNVHYVREHEQRARAISMHHSAIMIVSVALDRAALHWSKKTRQLTDLGLPEREKRHCHSNDIKLGCE